MFNLDDLKVEDAQTGASRVAGGAGMWLLHVAKITFIAYSAAHGINAVSRYAGSSVFAYVAQMVGVVTIEVTLLALYLAWHNGRVTGDAQKVAAALVYALAFALACANIVADSQANAGIALPAWLDTYMRWWLPASPALAAIGALIVHSLSPEQSRLRVEQQQRDALLQARFDAAQAVERAQLDESKTLAAMRLASRQAVMRNLADFWQSDDAQAAIRDTARRNMPQLLRDAGVTIYDERSADHRLPAQLPDLAAQTAEPEPEPEPVPAAIRPSANGHGPERPTRGGAHQ